MICLFFFFNDTATTEIYTLSLHDALPIFVSYAGRMIETFEPGCWMDPVPYGCLGSGPGYAIAAKLARPDRPVCLLLGDRKSTRLNSSHANISYAVFCLKKKNPVMTNFSLL